MMCLVIFGWLSNQDYFKELTDSNIRNQLYVEQQNLIEQDMAPFGFVDDGITKPGEETEVDMYGTVWHPVTRKGEQGLDFISIINRSSENFYIWGMNNTTMVTNLILNYGE